MNGQWQYRVVHFGKDEVHEMCFPNENYDYDELSKNSVFVGAYDRNTCIGLAILQHAMMKYMYLYDLKVQRGLQRPSGGKNVVDAAKEIAQAKVSGIYTLGQDDNLARVCSI